MNSKMIAVIAVVVIAVAGGAAAVVLMNNHGAKEDPLAYFDGVGLKVLGNENKDNVIDSNDYNAIQTLVQDKASVKDHPLADANHDGTIDEKDLEVVKKVIDKEVTTIWHINYHDSDSNGTMDKELVSTKVPVTSTIMTGSSNNFMMFTLLGIPAGDVVKGACYGTTNDPYLYKNTFLKTTLVEKLGGKSYEIEFENGKVGSSNLIQEKNVTCLVTDWNRIYIENEAAFESANVDVVRIAAASFEKEVYTHTIALLGTIFSVTEQANVIIDLYDKAAKEINDATSTLTPDKVKKAVASSTTGAISSGDSDYTAVCEAAGAEFGLKGYNFGGSSVVYANDNLGVFDSRTYKFDNIVHIRTGLSYNSKTADIGSMWAEYANGMSLWENVYDGQVLISGSIPVPCRVAFAAYAIYHDTLPDLSEAWAQSLLALFEAQYIGINVASAPNHTMVLTSYEFTVTVDPEVTVKDANNNVVASGTKFAYGTELSIEANTPDASRELVASGSKVVDGKFVVINDIHASYVEKSILNILSTAASNLVENYAGNTYMASAVANERAPGSVTITNSYYNGSDYIYKFTFEYYADVEDAKNAYLADRATASYGYDVKVGDSKTTDFNTSGIVEANDNEIVICFTGSHSSGSVYTGSTLYMSGYYKNLVWKHESPAYLSQYSFDEAFFDMSASAITEHFRGEVSTFVNALENAMKAAMATS